MRVSRREWLSLLLASAAAETLDLERLLWTPKAIITVPAMPIALHRGSLLTSGTLRALMDYNTKIANLHYEAHFMRYKLLADATV